METPNYPKHREGSGICSAGASAPGPKGVMEKMLLCSRAKLPAQISRNGVDACYWMRTTGEFNPVATSAIPMGEFYSWDRRFQFLGRNWCVAYPLLRPRNG
jgi:hypothetical protein